MLTGFLIAIVSSVQPVCSASHFQKTIGPMLRGDREPIARAIFDEYLEQVQAIETTSGSHMLSPRELLHIRSNNATQADMLFDELLASLSVVDAKKDWQRGIVDLRRTVLLRARQADNPWPATVWVDVPSDVPANDEVIHAIDGFLLENDDNDRRDRFSAFASILEGDSETCIATEQRSMLRWGVYMHIVEPISTEQLTLLLYPQLDRGEEVIRVFEWVLEHVLDDTITRTTRDQFVIWNTLHNQQNRDVIALIQDARMNSGFDPWSRGCGHRSNSASLNIKNKLGQRSAKTRELNQSTVDAMLQRLSEEQRQLFESG